METEAFCWIDVETNGLDTDNGFLLEVAMVLTDMKLNPIGSLHTYGSPLGNSIQEIYNRTDPFVQDMHTKSLLWKDLEENYERLPVTDFQVDEYLKTALERLIELHEIEKLYPAGSSVHFDMSWLKIFCSETTKLFNYRYLDASSIKLMNQIATGVKYESETESAHRAMSDIMESLEYVRSQVFPLENLSVQAAHASKILGEDD